MSFRHTSALLFCIVFFFLLPAGPLAWSESDKAPNIVLLTLDSARADRMGFLGAKFSTPNLDSIARSSIIFERAYSQAPLTVVSHATILSGTYPQTHRATELGEPIAPTVPFLPEILHAHGYQTGAFVSSILLDPINGLAPGFDRGFDSYDTGMRWPRTSEDFYPFRGRDPDQVVALALHWIGSRGNVRPFFVWINLDIPRERFDEASYDHALTMEDFAIRKLLAGMKEQKLLDASAVVVTSDCGESLGAHGEDRHGIFLYDETIHVPLLIKTPWNQLAGRRIKGRVRLLDVAPTILEMAKVPVPSQMQGQSLLRIAKSTPDIDQPAYARSDSPRQLFGWSGLESWRISKYLYIRAPKPELYDLTADPKATRNLAQKSTGTLETIAGQLDAFDRRLELPGGKPADTRLTSSEMQKLASLGYVGLQKRPSTLILASGADPKDMIGIANSALIAVTALEDRQVTPAILRFRQLLTAQGNTFLIQLGLGTALVQQQQYSEAIEHLHKAIELQPAFAWTHYEMGQSLLIMGDVNTAVFHLEIASHLLPKCSELHEALAETYMRLGRTKDADRERDKISQFAHD
jgi:arylsulfatase A-like enzyme